MHRTQIYLTDEQRRRLARRAADEGASQADVIRRMLDRELGILSGLHDVAVVKATAGILADHPDWPEWLADVRGRGSSERLRDLGL
jgi:Zn-dependent membrane protease YugP